MSPSKTQRSILLFVLTLLVTQINCHFKRVCYLRVDSSQRIAIETLDANLCTHIILGFAVVINGTIAPQETDDLNYYRNVTQLKKNNTELKIMLSVGGGGADTTGLHWVSSNQTNIDKLDSCYSLGHMTNSFRVGLSFRCWTCSWNMIWMD